MRLRIPKKYVILMYIVIFTTAVGVSVPFGSVTWVSERLLLPVGAEVNVGASNIPDIVNAPLTSAKISGESGIQANTETGHSELRPLAIAAAILMIALVGAVYAMRYFRLRHRLAGQTALIERKERLARSFLDLVADPMVLVNAEGLIETCNSGAETLLGYRESELVSRSFTVLLSDPELNIADFKRNAAYAAAESFSGGKLARVTVLRKDGKSLPVDVSVARSEIDGAVIYAGTLRELQKTEIGVASNRYSAPRNKSEGSGIGTDHAKAGRRVLLAEDHPINQHLTSVRLQELGCSVDVVETGTQAVEAVQEKEYDLILMDIRMPDMDGIQAIKKIRAMEGLDISPPIIVVTADGSGSARAQCLSVGANDFLSKPVSRSELLDIVSIYLEISIDTPHLSAEGDIAEDVAISELVRFEYQNKLNGKPKNELSKLIDDIEALEQTII